MTTYGSPGKTDDVIRHIIDLALATYGSKRGLHRAASLLGVSERWVKAFRFGEPARISADTYLRALDARATLASERAAQLRAELASLDQLTSRTHAHAPRRVLDHQPIGLPDDTVGRSDDRPGRVAHRPS